MLDYSIQDPLAVYDDGFPRCVGVKHVRTQISSVGPDNRAELRVHADLAEIVRVIEWSEDPVEGPNHSIQVNDRLQTILESKLEIVPIQGLSVYNIDEEHMSLLQWGNPSKLDLLAG